MLRLEQRQRSFCWFATWCAVPCRWKVQRECTSARVFAPTGNQSINQSWEEANLKFFTAFLTTEAKRGKDAKDSKKKEGPEGAELATRLPTGWKAIWYNQIQPGAALRSSSRPSNPQPVVQRLCTGSWRPQWLPCKTRTRSRFRQSASRTEKGSTWIVGSSSTTKRTAWLMRIQKQACSVGRPKHHGQGSKRMRRAVVRLALGSGASLSSGARRTPGIVPGIVRPGPEVRLSDPRHHVNVSLTSDLC